MTRYETWLTKQLEGNELEKQRSVDQKLAALSSFMDAHERILSRQGSIVESWREYNGKKLGPYYRLTCRVVGGKQESHYLGRNKQLIAAARARLESLQEPARLAKLERKMIRQLRDELQTCKTEWSRQLAEFGLTLKGNEVRGWRRSKPLTCTTTKKAEL